ncbi:transcriptional regulator [Streptomyces sp. NPDC102437]|uniref:transcriptional regulator n=1 Tax=Streptomyces sp. NPDC102437 TaxID=3366175 RepID=UPI0038307F1A
MGRPRLDQREPNEHLAQWQAQVSMSNAALARAVTKRARAQGHRGISPDESSVRRWRAGETPRHPVPQLIVETISERASIALSPADLGFPGLLLAVQGTGLSWLPGTSVQALLHLTRSEVMLTHTRNSTSASRVQKGSALLAPLQQWATTGPSSLTVPAGRTGGQVGAAEVEGIRAVTAMYRDVDNRHGGILSRKAVVAQLNEAASLLHTCTYTERTGRDLLAAVADLGSVAGWMSFDAGHHTSAQKLFITSLHAAAEAGDKALGAHILQCMARQMSHLERYEDALALVDLAQYGARWRLSPAASSMLASLEARFQAILGNLTDSETAAGRAEDAFTGIVPGNEPAHMMFFDTAELSATIGVAHQIAARNSEGTGRARHAESGIRLIQQALDSRPAHRVRSKAFDHLALARTHLAVGEPEGARQETIHALDLFGTISSHRVGDRLTELHDEALPYANSAPAIVLRERIMHALG